MTTPPSGPGAEREPTREELLAVVRRVWTDRDPLPDGLVARMQAAAALVAGPGLDTELMTLIEQSTELAGTRAATAAEAGNTAYTLRFEHGDIDLLLRVARSGGTCRIDGWVVPPEPVTVRVLAAGDSPRVLASTTTDDGRFDLADVPTGPTRLRLEPHDPARPPFLTPDFEL